MKKVVWLASYPKSGNTWMRTFLWAFQNKGPLNLNRMNTGGIFSGKSVIENSLDLNSDFLYQHEIEEFQTTAHDYLFENLTNPRFIKIHDAYTFSRWTSKPIVPLKSNHLVIYIVRNPMDVAPSFANHSSTDNASIIEKQINNPDGSLVKIKPRATTQFHQLMGSWSMHVNSWSDQTVAPVHLVRYEDMSADPFNTFKEILEKIGLEYTDEQILATIKRTDFKEIKKLEEEQGFREKPNPDNSFFQTGKVGRWKDELTQEQIQSICTIHEQTMKKLDYL